MAKHNDEIVAEDVVPEDVTPAEDQTDAPVGDEVETDEVGSRLADESLDTAVEEPANHAVLGDDEVSHDDRLDAAKRDALVNAQGEQDTV